MIRLLAVFWVGMLLTTTSAWADCQTGYDQAISLLENVRKKAEQDEHPNPDAFAAEFQKLVEQMQKKKCLPELKKLAEYIQAEQEKLKTDEKPVAMPLPIVD